MSHPAPFQPAIGTDFETEKERNRGFFLRFLAWIGGAVVVATGCYSFVTSNFMAIATVWAVFGPILGAMTSHYFGVAKE
jgi:hypothetical protein